MSDKKNWGYKELLSVRENVKENLGGNQTASILDYFLYKAIQPLVEHTKVVDLIFTSLLNQIYTDHRRRVTSLEKPHLLDLILRFLASKSPEMRMKFVRRMNLERNILAFAINLWSKSVEDYRIWEYNIMTKDHPFVIDDERKILAIENNFKVSRNKISPIYAWTSNYSSAYFRYKRYILEKYYRFSYKEAVNSSKNTELLIDTDELFDNLLLAADRAIDRYNPEKGTLTSYIQQWFMNAKTNPDFNHQYGSSYSMSNSTRKNVSKQYNSGLRGDHNFSVSLDEASNVVEDHTPNSERNMINQAELERIYILSKYAKGVRVALNILDVPYQFSPEEVALFRENAARSHKSSNAVK